MKFLITGAGGFVGRALCQRLLESGYSVRGTLIAGESPETLLTGVEHVVIESIGPLTSWCNALSGIDIVIHLAARVHVMDDTAADPLEEFRKVNAEGTRQLASEGAKAGIKRLVFVSSIKVNGEESATAYTENAPLSPQDAYGISKMEAELELGRLSAETGLDVVIIRPPLVYGPGVKANFLKMMTVVKQGIPLPLASINNRRSLIYIGNLVDAIATSALHLNAAGKSYPVSDGDDVSTPELIRRTAEALGLPDRLFPVPVAMLQSVAKLFGKSAAVERLTGSLTVDSTAIRKELGWKPPFTMKQGLQKTADWYQNCCR